MVDLLNKNVTHKIFGRGTVIALQGTEITVQFAIKTSQFTYPTAFEEFLTLEDPETLSAVQAEVAAEKEVELLAKKAKLDADTTQWEEQRLSRSNKGASSAKAYKPVQRTPGKALTYLVFQGATFDEEYHRQFIWAPKFDNGGNIRHHWDRLMDVREGDVILHCSNGYIQAISKATGACEDCQRPGHSIGDVDWDQWNMDGRKVSCDYTMFEKPLKHGDYKETIIKYCNVKYAPFDKDGNGNMGYLFDINKDLTAFFVQEIAKRNSYVNELDYLKFLLA